MTQTGLPLRTDKTVLWAPVLEQAFTNEHWWRVPEVESITISDLVEDEEEAVVCKCKACKKRKAAAAEAAEKASTAATTTTTTSSARTTTTTTLSTAGVSATVQTRGVKRKTDQ